MRRHTSSSGHKVEGARFSFPRQPSGERLCISDYFADIDSGLTDVMVLQTVTVGHAATQEFDRLQAADAYSDAYFFHGLAVQAAEATANYLTRLVEGQLGIAQGRANATAGVIPPAPTWKTTPSCCVCCRS